MLVSSNGSCHQYMIMILGCINMVNMPLFCCCCPSVLETFQCLFSFNFFLDITRKNETP